jgi:hypothetical protein
MLQRSPLVVLAALAVLAGCAPVQVMATVPSGPASNPDTATIASVDRFSDSFAHLFKRSGPGFDTVNVAKVVPAPNAPIDMDKYFLVKALGPSGEKVAYYALDLLGNVPATGYVFKDPAGQMLANQLPVIETIPGDTGFNDFVRITEVTVPAGYTANVLADADGIKAAAAAGQVKLNQTSRIANWAVVPSGTTATGKFNGQAVSGHRAWYKKQVAPYLLFDTQLQLTADGKVPDSPIVVIFANGKDPSMGFKADANGQTHNALATLPGQPTYSSLWIHNVQGNPAGFDGVTDFASALKNQSGPLGVSVNCPVVTP